MNRYLILVFLLFLVPAALVTYKVGWLGYSYENILPTTSYSLRMDLTLTGFGEDASCTTWLPVTSERQFVWNEEQELGVFRSDMEQSEFGKKVVWYSPGYTADKTIRYACDVRGSALVFEIDSSLSILGEYPPNIRKYTKAEKGIQSDHPLILDKSAELTKGAISVREHLESFYQAVVLFENRDFKGYTDAITTLKLREASCNGKSRLFVALCRSVNIPARLAGGLILESGSKRVSHQWAEVYINGFWVPFDTVNDHFASIPANYLELYKSDLPLFTHSPNTGLDYLFTIEKGMVPNPELEQELSGSVLNSYKMWNAFERAGIPLGLLKVILLMPLGAMIVAVFRNVIGLKTFGVFLPALIAVAVGYTGLIWGLLAFVLVILIVSLMHFPLERLGMLYTPKLVIMLVSVVIAFIALSVLGIYLDYTQLAYITLFPVVVITITAERFARTIMEEGYPKALKVTAQTLLVVLAAYLGMNSRTMEALFLAFPELFLIIVGLMLLLGRWIGIRLSEYQRFKPLLR